MGLAGTDTLEANIIIQYYYKSGTVTKKKEYTSKQISELTTEIGMKCADQHVIEYMT